MPWRVVPWARFAGAGSVADEGERYVDLPDDLLALLREPSTCYVTTLMPDGSPQLTQTWVDTDGSRILINTVETHQKSRNVRRDPRVVVAVSDPVKPTRYHAVRGRVVGVSTRGR
jgi:PPOX class probable F420-dependent enzyme